MPFSEPQLSVVYAAELPLSGLALLELMRAVLAKGVPFRFKARGWSMAPFIRDGDVITISPPGGSLPGIGKVVAFIRPEDGKLVVHRIVGRQGAAVLIQGDNVTSLPDGIVPQENLLGRVMRIERDGRPIWMGLGPERFLIAWFSRLRFLIPMRFRLALARKRYS